MPCAEERLAGEDSGPIGPKTAVTVRCSICYFSRALYFTKTSLGRQGTLDNRVWMLLHEQAVISRCLTWVFRRYIYTTPQLRLPRDDNKVSIIPRQA
jgi:hypothetical protein